MVLVLCRGLGWPGSVGRVHPPITGNKTSGIGERPFWQAVAMTETCLFCNTGRQMFVRKSDEASVKK